ncbi:MAG: EAL domain-containing protein [Sulfurimonas sp.]|jgi:diguanylate cyclase (GGDEF)-like protein/PAS domain S-box-containing protein
MSKQNKFFNNNTLYFVTVIFIAVIIFRIISVYFDTKEREYQFAQKEAEVLNSYAMVHRNYYQNFFIDKTIPLNEKTLHALPAFSSLPISDQFSHSNSLNIMIRTVSDRARNPVNNADQLELKAINYFKENAQEKEYFSDSDSEFYQYGHALRIEQKCLLCHGKKEEAPEFISKKYEMAYDYKIGEVRGIVSIKLPKSSVREYFIDSFIKSVFYDVLLLAVLFMFIYYLVRKSNKINKLLEEEVAQKTLELRSKNMFLNSYIQALDNSSALTKADIDGKITYVNDKFLASTGYKREEVIGKSHNIIKHPDTSDEMIHGMWNTITNKKTWEGVIKGLRKDKTLFINQVSIIPVLDEHNNITEYIAPRIDLTELIYNKEKLEEAFLTDSLTSLPNRQKLIDDIRVHAGSKSLHLALLNIDRFKDINDFYGHKVADEVLKQIATILKELCFQEESNFYKLPSDEYAVLTTMDMSSYEFVKRISAVIKSIMETKLEVDEYSIFISFSCGVASNTFSLIVKADMALQIAKEKKENIVVYDDALDIEKNIIKNIEGVRLLKDAIEHDSIVPYFQPIYNLHSNKIEKYECLARVVTKEGSVIAPFYFLDIAIKSKLYPNITKSILTKSFEFFEDKEYEFSINFSMEDVLNKATVEFIIDNLKEFKHADRVVFEILESEKIDKYEELKEFIQKVKVYGCKIAIDDFGSGYSNFAHILELNVDYLKIDASLVKSVTTDENSRKITQTIINFAKDLNLKTIAEFVEDKESLELLKEMGADYIQGYYIGKPEDKLVP